MKEPDNDRGFIAWEIPFSPGKLEVFGYNAGQEVTHCYIETSKRPFTIQAEAVNREIGRNGGVALVKIQITDEDGRAVFLSDDEITCTTTGPVRLVGLEAGNPVDMGDYTDNRQRVYQGKMMA